MNDGDIFEKFATEIEKFIDAKKTVVLNQERLDNVLDTYNLVKKYINDTGEDLDVKIQHDKQFLFDVYIRITSYFAFILPHDRMDFLIDIIKRSDMIRIQPTPEMDIELTLVFRDVYDVGGV